MAGLREHVRKELEKARKFGEKVREAISDEKWMLTRWTEDKEDTFTVEGGSIEYLESKRKSKGTKTHFGGFALLSTRDAIHALDTAHNDAHGRGGWHDGTKKSKLDYATRNAGNKIDWAEMQPMVFPVKQWGKMNQIIKELAQDINDGKIKMHFPEYQIVVNGYYISFLEAIGAKAEGAFDKWMNKEDGPGSQPIWLNRLGY